MSTSGLVKKVMGQRTAVRGGAPCANIYLSVLEMNREVGYAPRNTPAQTRQESDTCS